MKTDLDLIRKIVAGEEFPLTINYNRTLEEMIDAGHYDQKDNNIISENFPVLVQTGLINKTDCIRAKLLIPERFFGYHATERELVRINVEGYRPSTLSELLAFGEIHPEIQQHFPVISLGSIWERKKKMLEESYYRGPFIAFLSFLMIKRTLETRSFYKEVWGDNNEKFLVILRE